MQVTQPFSSCSTRPLNAAVLSMLLLLFGSGCQSGVGLLMKSSQEGEQQLGGDEKVCGDTKTTTPTATQPTTAQDHFGRQKRAIGRDIVGHEDMGIVQEIVKDVLRSDYEGQLAKLQTTFNEAKSSKDKKASIDNAIKLVQKAHFLAPAVCMWLLKAPKKAEWRHDAIIEVLKLMVGIVPTHTDAALEAFRAACKDADENVCGSAAKMLISLVKTIPNRKEDILEALLSAYPQDCKERSPKAFLWTLKGLISSMPLENALTILSKPILRWGEDDKACGAAMDILTDLACASFGTALKISMLPGAEKSTQLQAPFKIFLSNEVYRHLRQPCSEAIFSYWSLPRLLHAFPDYYDEIFLSLVREIASPEIVEYELVWWLRNPPKCKRRCYPRSVAAKGLITLMKMQPQHTNNAISCLSRYYPSAVIDLVKADAKQYIDVALRYLDSKHYPAVAEAAPEYAGKVVKKLLEHSRTQYSANREHPYLQRLASTYATEDVFEIVAQFCSQEEKSVYARENAVYAMGYLVMAASRHAKAALPILLDAYSQGAESPELRKAAIWALCNLAIVAPEHAEAVLKVLCNACIDDRDWRARRQSVYALKKLGANISQHLVCILQALYTTCLQNAIDRGYVHKYDIDTHTYVIHDAIEAVEALVIDSPQHIESALEVLYRASSASETKECIIRAYALGAMSKLIRVAPSQHRESMLKHLLRIVKTEKVDSVCADAIRALGELVKVSPDYTENALKFLLRMYSQKQKKYRTRLAYIDTLSDLARIAPQHGHAVEALKAIISTCTQGEEDDRVCRAAMDAFDKLVKKDAKAAVEALSVVHFVYTRSVVELAQKAPTEATLEAFTQVLSDVKKNTQVRCDVAKAIGVMAARAPEHTVKALGFVI